MAKASLVILAAGLGTRFRSGIKQLAPVGPNGELLMEYSVSSAVNAGFDKIIFIIRRDIEQDISEIISQRLSVKFPEAEILYCFQDADSLPEGFSVPEGRKKPWGTVHAVLAAKELINEPFLIINADDYYGESVYEDIFKYLNESCGGGRLCMAGFMLKNTLSSRGSVTRGICTADSSGFLLSVSETYGVHREADGIHGTRNGEEVTADENSIVSMNMWGCGKEFIPMLEDVFVRFLRGEADLSSAELALPTAVDMLIGEGKCTVKVLETHDKWHGMTYAEDIEDIRKFFSEMQ